MFVYKQQYFDLLNLILDYFGEENEEEGNANVNHLARH